MSERYQIFDQDSPVDSQQLAAFLAKDGQLLLPMVELVEQAQCAVDEVIDVMGMAKLKQYAQWLERDWLERDWPAAARRIRDGLSEIFTINRLGLPSQLRRCLGTTNLIDNGHSAIRQRMQRVKNWQNGTMALRWTAAAFEASSKGYRRIMGYEQLWS